MAGPQPEPQPMQVPKRLRGEPPLLTPSLEQQETALKDPLKVPLSIRHHVTQKLIPPRHSNLYRRRHFRRFRQITEKRDRNMRRLLDLKVHLDCHPCPRYTN